MIFKNKKKQEKFLEDVGITKLYKEKYQEALDTIAEKDKKITELEAKVKKLSYFVTNQIRIEIEGK